MGLKEGKQHTRLELSTDRPADSLQVGLFRNPVSPAKHRHAPCTCLHALSHTYSCVSFCFLLFFLTTAAYRKSGTI